MWRKKSKFLSTCATRPARPAPLTLTSCRPSSTSAKCIVSSPICSPWCWKCINKHHTQTFAIICSIELIFTAQFHWWSVCPLRTSQPHTSWRCYHFQYWVNCFCYCITTTSRPNNIITRVLLNTINTEVDWGGFRKNKTLAREQRQIMRAHILITLFNNH